MYDPSKPGILDVFLACIAKALTLQTKVKGASSKGMPSSVKLADFLNAGWVLEPPLVQQLGFSFILKRSF